MLDITSVINYITHIPNNATERTTMASLKEEFNSLTESQKTFVESLVMKQMNIWKKINACEMNNLVRTDLFVNAPNFDWRKVSSHITAAIWSLENKNVISWDYDCIALN